MLSQSHAKFLSPVGSDTLVLLQAFASERLADLYEVEVVAVAETAAIDEASILGKDCAVEVKTSLGKLAWFSGQASRFSYLGIVDHNHQFSISLRPTLWFLGYNKRYTIYQDKSVVEILQLVLKRAGVTRVRFEHTGSYEPIEYVVQYAESDLNFVQRLIEHHGLFYWFEHAAGGETLVIVDDVSSLKPSDPASLPFATRMAGDGRNAHREEVTGWQQSTRVASHHYAARDYDFKRPPKTLDSQDTKGPQRSANVQERYVYPGSYDNEGEATRLATLRTEYMKGARERFEGRLDAIKCRAGYSLVLTEHPHAPYNQKYIALASNWNIHAAGTRSSSDAGWVLDGVVEFQKASLPYRARLSATKPRASGPHTARVVGPPGQEIWSDKYGRVKVSFQWDRESTEDDRSSCFLRVMTPWAGPQRGFFALPRIGDEVLIWFLDGDPDRPIVAGSVFNADNVDPTLRETTHMALRSRSTTEGGSEQFNELRFEDTTGQERVYVQAEKNLQFLVKNDRLGKIEHDETKKIGNNRNIRIGANDQLKVGKFRTTEIGDDDSLKVGVNRDATIGSNDDLTVGASRSASILDDDTIKVGSNRETLIGLDDDLIVGASRSADVGQDDTLSVGMSRSVRVGQNLNLVVGQSFSIDVSNGFDIKVGAARLSMKSDGSITLSGVNIELDSTAQLKLSGMTASLSGTTTVDVSAGTKATMDGILVNLDAKGIAQVSGALVKIG